MKLRKYNQEQLIEAVKKSFSLAQTLKRLGVAPYGGNYVVLKKAIAHFKLDTSHFTGQIWNKGKKLPPRQPLEKYLNNEIKILSFKLKNRLLKEKVFPRKCSNCRLENWLGQPIPLELDHIDGKSSRQSAFKSATALPQLPCPNSDLSG